MHIIGIEIENGCNPKVIKNLSPGEYPFGNYQLPNDNDYRWRNGSEQSDRLYQIYPTMPQISVSCIIGMNGSGKTTLLDVLFRIINNYAAIVCKNTKEYGSPIDTYEVEYAEGLNAKLYFEVEGNIGYINSTYKCGDNKEPVKFVKIVNEDYSRHLNDYQSFLSSLFYTIGINYSIHSMRFIERQGNKEGFNEWMGNIFINEDNYLVPLTFAPYRVDGVIDINREDYLACRRLTTLSILLHSQGKQLMKGYRPSKISFKPKEIITENYLLEERKMNKLALRKGVPYSYAGIIKGFKNLWEPIVAKYGIFYKDKWDIITESLAYETTRICLISLVSTKNI